VGAGGWRECTGAHGGFDGVIVLGRVVSMQCRRGRVHICRCNSRMHACMRSARHLTIEARARTHHEPVLQITPPALERAVRKRAPLGQHRRLAPDVDDGLHAVLRVERADSEVERALPRVRAGRVRARVRGVQICEVRVRVEDRGDEGCVKRGQVLRERGVRRRCVASAGALRRAWADLAVTGPGRRGMVCAREQWRAESVEHARAGAT
jgi:hypothetical protein